MKRIQTNIKTTAVLLIIASVLSTPFAARAAEIDQQITAAEQLAASYQNQQNELSQQAELTEDGLKDAQGALTKQQAEVDLANAQLQTIVERIAKLKAQRAEAMRASYRGENEASYLFALASSSSLTDFLRKGAYTDYLVKRKVDLLDSVDTELGDLERQRQNVLTKKNQIDTLIAEYQNRVQKIQAALAANQNNLDAANRLRQALLAQTGNFNQNNRPFLRNNEPVGDSITIMGGGTEHGLGMSQYGAKGYAERGWDYRRIVTHYYPGATLSNSGSRVSEDYVARVVGGEIGGLISKFPAEALKAQAVAARSYASVNPGGQDCTDRTQVCSSGAPPPQAVAAAQATAGQVLTYQGKVIQAYFHSTSGGWTENNENVWGGSPIAWLRGVESPYETDSPHWEWRTKTYSKQQMADILNKDERTRVGALQTIKITGRGVSGRVLSMQIVGTNGTIKRVTGPEFKRIFYNNSPPDESHPNPTDSTMFGFI